MNNLKNIFGLISLSFIFLSASNCGSSQNNKSVSFEVTPPFSISEIFAQDWVAGVKEGGSGTNVNVTFENLNENISIENIYYSKKVFLVRQAGNNSKTYVGFFKQKAGREIIMDSNPVNEAKNTPPIPFPFELEPNEAVISYIENGTTKFYKVSDVTIKPRIAYPKANPDGID